MAIEVDKKAHDLQLKWVPPQSDSDARVPTAEELLYGEELTLAHLQAGRMAVKPAGVTTRPSFTAGGSKTITIPQGLGFYSHLHPTLTATPAAHTLTMPALVDTATSISRYDRIYLLCFACEIDSAIDSDLGLTFTWRDQSASIQTVTKENTIRHRSFYAFVWNAGPLDESTLLSRFTLSGADRQFTASASNAGVAVGDSQLYTLDSNFTAGTTYTVVQDSLELIELLRVWRVQETNQNGYLWGNGGESDFLAEFHLQPSYRYVGEDWDNWQARVRESLYRIMIGKSLSDTPTKDRSVQNLVNGQVGTNTTAPGIATASPNGSTALANEQRIQFLNKAVAQGVYAIAVTTTDDGGNAVATVNFAGNSPSGSAFASGGHKIYAPDGTDISADGSFTGGGGTGALTWTESSSASIAPGDTAYLVPVIDYPSGSGFPVAGEIEEVYLGATALDSANVLETDISAYTEPANSESHIVVLSRGNAGVQWIYKKFTVTSSGSGVAVIPSNARGLIAFISGSNAPSGRQDLPVITGLDNSTNYDILCYHAPPGSEQWQFQLKTARYAGTDERSFVGGARVNTQPIAIAHSQGGGNTYFLADGSIQVEPVAFRLPSNGAAGSVKSYTFDSKIQVTGEADPGNLSFREIFYQGGGNGLTGLRPGLTLTATNAAESQSQSQEITIEIDSVGAGVIKPKLAGDTAYQLVLACDIKKDGEHRLLVAAINEGAADEVNYQALDTDSTAYAAIDTFKYY